MAIRYITHQQIDRNKWDNCIEEADNGLIYAQTTYLDEMSENWDAVISGDYEYVMPLTYKIKFGIQYLYQPYFTASLGVFGKNVSAALLEEFLQSIPAKFRYWDIYINPGNYFELKSFDLYQRVNYTLDLNRSYEIIYAGYRENIKRNIKKAEQLKCTVKRNIDIDEVIRLAMEQSQNFAPISKEDYQHFKALYQQLSAEQKTITYGVYTFNNQLVASCVLFRSHKRLYYILVGNHPNGKAVGASHSLVNAFIKDHCGQELLLDFEGSDISSLAFFYSSFGAIPEKYAGLKLNRLPWLLRLFKK